MVVHASHPHFYLMPLAMDHKEEFVRLLIPIYVSIRHSDKHKSLNVILGKTSLGLSASGQAYLQALPRKCQFTLGSADTYDNQVQVVNHIECVRNQI